MSLNLMVRDPTRICPCCEERSGLDYVPIPDSVRTHGADGEVHSHHFGPTRDYKCRNCDCEFTLTAWENEG